MEIRYNITFNLRAYGKNRDKHQIRMRVTFNGQQLDFATGSILADKEAWDVQTETVRDGYVGPRRVTGVEINNSLRNVRSQMITSFKYFEANDVYPTAEQLSEKFKERMTGVVPKKPEPKKEEGQQEQKEELPTEHADQPQPSEQQEPDNAGESDPEIVVHKDEMVNFDTGNGTKLYKSKGDYTQAQVTDIVQNGKIDEFFDEQLPPPPDEIPAKELDEHGEENEQESDEETHDDSKPAETQEEAAPSEETHDDAEAGAEAALKDSETENKEKKESCKKLTYYSINQRNW